MTRPELARKLGVTANYISDVERGARKPSQKYICDVTGTLGLSTSEVKKALEHDIANGMPSTENVIPFEAR
jgi:transcriptional regulator with XRE-family HTH domain